MTQTIFITGASSGMGKHTAKLFQSKGWNVVATMRSPEKETELTELENVLVLRLDVTDHDSINAARDAAVAAFGKVDVLLNNAGYGAFGPLETFPMAGIEKQFATNVLGLIATTKAFIPHMRENASGTIVNVSSMGGRITFPLASLYHGTKYAVEGFTESLRYELEAFGVRVKLVEPGNVNTDFSSRSLEFVMDQNIQEYLPTAGGMNKLFEKMAPDASEVGAASDVIWSAATDGSDTFRYVVGEDARKILSYRNSQDDDAFHTTMKDMMK